MRVRKLRESCFPMLQGTFGRNGVTGIEGMPMTSANVQLCHIWADSSNSFRGLWERRRFDISKLVISQAKMIAHAVRMNVNVMRMDNLARLIF